MFHLEPEVTFVTDITKLNITSLTLLFYSHCILLCADILKEFGKHLLPLFIYSVDTNEFTNFSCKTSLLRYIRLHEKNLLFRNVFTFRNGVGLGGDSKWKDKIVSSSGTPTPSPDLFLPKSPSMDQN